MKNKVCSWILVIAMLLSYVTMVSAEDAGYGTADNWDCHGRNLYLTTTEDSYSGNASIKFIGKNLDGSALFQNVTYEEGATYDLTVYAKLMDGKVAFVTPDSGVDWRWMMAAYPGATFADSAWLSNWEIHNAENAEKHNAGWRKYTKQITATGNVFSILNYSILDNFVGYMDDISVVRADDTTNTNLITNGGFEAYTALNLSITSTSKADGQATVTWKNPAVASAAISMTINGEAVDLSDASLAKYAENTKTVNGLEKDTEYEIVITAQTDYGSFRDLVTVEIPSLKYGRATSWSALGNKTYVTTTEDSYSGKAAMLVEGKNTGTVASQSVAWEDSATYKVSFYAKTRNKKTVRQEWNWLGSAYLGTINYGVNQHLKMYSSTATAKDGWYYYELVYAPIGNKSFTISREVNTYEDGWNMLIDDISVVKVGDATNTNLIVNGGFEDYTELNVAITDTVVSDSAITVSWKNPTVLSTGITMTVNGEAVELTDVNYERGAVNTKVLTGLKNDKDYEIIITAVTAYGEYSTSVTATPGATIYAQPENWSASTTFVATNEDNYSGKMSLKMSGLSDKTFIKQRSTADDLAAEYKITVYAKILNNGSDANVWKFMVNAFLGAATGENMHIGAGAWTSYDTDKEGWKRYEATYVPTTDVLFSIGNNNPTTTETGFVAYLDDISVVKVGDATNTNLITNGGFERYQGFDTDVVTDASIYETYLMWTNEGATDYHKIYKLVDGERTLLGQTTAGNVTYYDLESVSEGDTFVITSVYGSFESAGVTVRAALTLEPIFGIGSVSENGDITITEELTAIKAGTIVAGVKEINNLASTATKGKVYVALYNNNRLEGVSCLDLSELAGYEKQELAVSVAVPEAGENDKYSIQVMTWKGETMIPIDEAFTLK